MRRIIFRVKVGRSRAIRVPVMVSQATYNRLLRRGKPRGRISS